MKSHDDDTRDKEKSLEYLNENKFVPHNEPTNTKKNLFIPNKIPEQ